MRHSMEHALTVQKAFEARYARAKGVLGIGIGFNRAQDDLALNVSVAKPAQAAKLPKAFEGLDVVIDVVGEFKAC
jgi:hypothetical protein